MKLNKKYLFETILETIEEEHSWSSAEELNSWIVDQITLGVRKIKTGEGDFDFDKFKKVADKLTSLKTTIWFEYGYQPQDEHNAKTILKEELEYRGMWDYFPGAYRWESKCSKTSRFSFDMCIQYQGRWTYSQPKLRTLAEKWLEKFKKHKFDFLQA